MRTRNCQRKRWRLLIRKIPIKAKPPQFPSSSGMKIAAVLSFFQNSIISEIILNTLESASPKKIQKRQFFILKNISCQFKIFKIETAARRISPQAALWSAIQRLIFGYCFQISFGIAVQNQVCISHRVIADQIIKLRPLIHIRVDLTLGKQDNRLHMGRGNNIDVRLPLFVLGNKSTDRSCPGCYQ